ncbi:hypothetical protein [Streptomyces sp. NPDC002855]|uniref:hypothetical protein n=1 Tax=Streptomyces sp. NPDC002855 TaxID=3154437 RepID=UPI00332225E9
MAMTEVRYAYGTDKHEALSNAIEGHCFRDESTAKMWAKDRTDQDICDTKCTFKVWKVVTSREITEVE